MHRYAPLLGVLWMTLWACTNDTPTTTTTTTTVPEPDLELVERTDYEADSSIRVVYQAEKNSDVRYGSYKEYDAQTNALLIERQYESGKIEGVEKIYYPDGQVEAEIGYRAGVHDGPFKYYYPNGQLKQEGRYTDGKVEGALKTYYSNGQLKEEVAHVNGVTEGPFKEYNENGTLKAEGQYTSKGDDESLEEGLAQFYDENGELERKAVCKQGQCCTIWTAQRGDIVPSDKICQAIYEDYKGEK